MREGEIAALADEFFEPTFNHDRAVAMLGSPVGRDELDGRVITYLRPDARTLARVEVFATLPEDPHGAPFVDELILVLRGARTYSRTALEEILGPARKRPGPPNEDGEPSWQLEFDQFRTLHGTVMARWWAQPEDPEAMGEPHGPDEVRVEEIHLRRFPAGTLPQRASVPPRPSTPPIDLGDLDEAMDTGGWLANLAWRILRFDFTLAHAYELLGTAVEPPREGTGATHLVPHDPRLERITLVLSEGAVVSVRLEAPVNRPLVLSLDAMADRLNTTVVHQHEGTVQLPFEATRARGLVTLETRQKYRGAIVAVSAATVTRGS